MYTGTRMSGVECLSTTACSSPNGVVKPWGGFGGVYYDFRNFGPIRIGVDLRAGGLHSNRSASSSSGGSNITSAQTFLGGLRGSVKTPIKWLSPYAQVSAGYTRSNVTEPVNGSLATSATDATPPRTYDGFVQYEGFVGADVHVFPFLDVRPIEVGIGNMNRSGTGNGSTSIGLMSIGAGVVLRFGH